MTATVQRLPSRPRPKVVGMDGRPLLTAVEAAVEPHSSTSPPAISVFAGEPARVWHAQNTCQKSGAAMMEFARPRASVGNLILQLAGAAFILMIAVEAVVLMSARP